MQRPMTNGMQRLPASALTVEAVETFLVDLPIVRPHLLSVATMRAQTLMIVKVLCSDGIVGVGEGSTKTIDTIASPLAFRSAITAH